MLRKFLISTRYFGFLLLILVFTIPSTVNAQSRLYSSVINDNISQAKRALKRGENPNGDGNPQQIPFIAAAELNYFHLVVLLANSNANINIQNHIGFTALMEATIQRNNRIMGFLIGKGAKLEIRANNGATALMVGVTAANVRGTKLLLESGANPNVYDNNGLTPLMRTMEIGTNIDLVKLLVQFNADVNGKTPEGKPVIMVYPYRNRIIAHLELINQGADVNIRDNDGKTPLIKAVLEGNLEMAKLLLDNGANKHLQDNTGTSAIDYAYAQMEMRQFFESFNR